MTTLADMVYKDGAPLGKRDGPATWDELRWLVGRCAALAAKEHDPQPYDREIKMNKALDRNHA